MKSLIESGVENYHLIFNLYNFTRWSSVIQMEARASWPGVAVQYLIITSHANTSPIGMRRNSESVTYEKHPWVGITRNITSSILLDPSIFRTTKYKSSFNFVKLCDWRIQSDLANGSSNHQRWCGQSCCSWSGSLLQKQAHMIWYYCNTA